MYIHDVGTTGNNPRKDTETRLHKRRWEERGRDGENEGMKKEALNVCVKTDDFPFNTPLSSLLSSVLPAAVTAPQLSSFHNNNPQIIQPHTHTHTTFLFTYS